jgi:hypothetical protein
MAITYVPEEEELDAPPTEPKTARRLGGWSLHPQPRVGLDMGSDDDMLMIENKTIISWVVYHNYHQLCVIDPSELLVFHLCKHGTLNVRPTGKEDTVEYLVLSLTYTVNLVHIYKRQMSKDLEIYDMCSF